MPNAAVVYGKIGKFEDMDIHWFPLSAFEFITTKDQIEQTILCLQSA